VPASARSSAAATRTCVRTLIRNYDVRWELYPSHGEVLSVALFAKQFSDPIEPRYQGRSGTNSLWFQNAESAVNYGIELEAMRRLGFIAQSLQSLAFANATIMKSEVTTGVEGDPSRRMTGQAPYVVNAGLTWQPGRLDQRDGPVQRGRRADHQRAAIRPDGAGHAGAAAARARCVAALPAARRRGRQAGPEEPAGLAVRGAPGRRDARLVPHRPQRVARACPGSSSACVPRGSPRCTAKPSRLVTSP
jgi:hypothetical protein